MPDLPVLTESLCPHCLCRVTARRITENNALYMEKSCPTHGRLDRVLLWRNSPYSYPEWSRQTGECSGISPVPVSDSSSGCPFNCGICPDHRQDTCTAIIEVTRQCNMHCPVCFAASDTITSVNPEMKQIARMLRTLLDRGGPYPVQLSGGEPTLRDDLPEIVALARNMGFDHVQINTNGIRLAQDADYGRALKESGASVVFLQFDGLTDDVHVHIRGTKLSEIKQRAVERCAELKLGVILVPTLVKGINDSQIGAILHFARKWIPVVKGVHFQPLTYIGRYPETPFNERRVLIPDILNAIQEQTQGELRVENFLPSECEESHCSFSAFAVLGEDGKLIPTTHFEFTKKAETCCSKDPAGQSRDYVRSLWKYNESKLTVIDSKIKSVSGVNRNTPVEDLFERARSHSLSISGMAFQDAWNVDLERLKRCCVHVVTSDAILVPFCAYYMTGSLGQRLYDGSPKAR
jgi:uncharacterized radical SAM superfamily Fe-S cluster-containing enzyme